MGEFTCLSPYGCITCQLPCDRGRSVTLAANSTATVSVPFVLVQNSVVEANVTERAFFTKKEKLVLDIGILNQGKNRIGILKPQIGDEIPIDLIGRGWLSRTRDVGPIRVDGRIQHTPLITNAKTTQEGSIHYGLIPQEGTCSSKYDVLSDEAFESGALFDMAGRTPSYHNMSSKGKKEADITFYRINVCLTSLRIRTRVEQRGPDFNDGLIALIGGVGGFAGIIRHLFVLLNGLFWKMRKYRYKEDRDMLMTYGRLQGKMMDHIKSIDTLEEQFAKQIASLESHQVDLANLEERMEKHIASIDMRQAHLETNVAILANSSEKVTLGVQRRIPANDLNLDLVESSNRQDGSFRQLRERIDEVEATLRALWEPCNASRTPARVLAAERVAERLPAFPTIGSSVPETPNLTTIQEQLTLDMVKGHWANGRWFITLDGEAFFEGKKVGDEFNLYVVDGIIKRYDGWQVEMTKSNSTRLLWTKKGEINVEWRRPEPTLEL